MMGATGPPALDPGQPGAGSQGRSGLAHAIARHRHAAARVPVRLAGPLHALVEPRLAATPDRLPRPLRRARPKSSWCSVGTAGKCERPVSSALETSRRLPPPDPGGVDVPRGFHDAGWRAGTKPGRNAPQAMSATENGST